jgi:hypothetical protein
MVIGLIATTAWMVLLFLVLALCRASASSDATLVQASGDRRRYASLPRPSAPRSGRPMRRALAVRNQAVSSDR